MQINGNNPQQEQQSTVKKQPETSDSVKPSHITDSNLTEYEEGLLQKALDNPEAKKALGQEFLGYFGKKVAHETKETQAKNEEAKLEKKALEEAKKLPDAEVQKIWEKAYGIKQSDNDNTWIAAQPFKDNPIRLNRTERAALKLNEDANNVYKLHPYTSPENRNSDLKVREMNNEFGREINKSKNKLLGFPENTTEKERTQYLKTLDEGRKLLKGY